MKKELRESYIRTFTGKKFHIFNPTEDEIDVRDCAHSLSFQCRFNSHTPIFYSVGSHSLIGAKLIEKKFKKAFLTHDFSEAYTGDCVTPIKRNLIEWQGMEARIDKKLSKKFRVPYPMSSQVKDMDKLMLRMELVYLMGGKKEPNEIFPLNKKEFMKEVRKNPKQVEKEIIKMFKELDNESENKS